MATGINRQQLDQWLRPLASVLRDKSVDAVDIVCGGGLTLARGALREQLELSIDAASLREIAQSCLGDPLVGQAQIQTLAIDEELDLNVARAVGPSQQIHLRITRRDPQELSMADLVDRDLLPALAARFLEAALGARLSLVLGGSLHGEARLLARALLGSLSGEERTLHICQRPDEALSLPGVMSVLGGDDSDLLDKALQMGPDRMFVLHPRGSDLRWWLRRASGLPGSLACVTACSVAGVLAQLAHAAWIPPSIASPPWSDAAVDLLVLFAPSASGQARLDQVHGRDHSSPQSPGWLPLWTRQHDLSDGSVDSAPLRPSAHLLAALARIQSRGVALDPDLLRLAVERGSGERPPASSPLPLESSRQPPRVDSGPMRPPAVRAQAPSSVADHPVPLPDLAPLSSPDALGLKTIEHDDPGWELEILARGAGGLAETAEVSAPRAETSYDHATAMDLPRRGLSTAPADNDFDALLAQKKKQSLVDSAVGAEASLLGPAETGYLHLEPPPMPAPPPDTTPPDPAVLDDDGHKEK